ncbi:MAG: transcription termination/antitermination protein NusG [Rickettsiaceae bacterium]|nr:transcription termination/antitermination protein NusG [Rickettsiaceae bacterium]
MSYRWYIIHTISGSEKKVKQAILEQAKKKAMDSLFEEIVIPAIEVPELKKGKQILTEKKFMPGYMLIKMDMTDDAWHLVKSTPKVTGFLGSGNRPFPVSEKEVANIFSQLENKAKDVGSATLFDIGEVVKVIDGPFESFSGSVEDVDYEKTRLRVSVTIFGRSTPIDLTFNQVEKIH